FDQVGDERPVQLWAEMAPARERGEDDLFGRGVLTRLEPHPTLTSSPFLGTVEPGPFDRIAGEQGGSTMNTGPVGEVLDQSLLDAMREQVLKPGDLGRLLLADDNGLVTPAPDLVLPAGAARDLAGEVGIEIAHEERELLGVGDVEEEVKVVGQEDVGAKADGVEALGTTEDTQEDVVELGAGEQKE